MTAEERVWKEYAAQEAERCEHGVLPENWCEDCYDESGGDRGHPGSRCTPFCGHCGRCG
jgi:hypothetical protein